MTPSLHVYNSISRKKEVFVPIQENYVGMYVCGPTVYGEPHLGHARSAVTFDIVRRYLEHLGYKVRHVRNITDVGHLENDADEGEDKIAKKARLDKVEPMEIVQYYTLSYHDAMRALNNLPPSIEPSASGHIIEQINVIQKILDNGYAYEVNGSVYFDVVKYNKDQPYGILSGRKIEDLLDNSRALEGQDEKKNGVDFALWKKAKPEHIMRWPSPWSDGFPGWHLECTAMSTKYLGEKFDIHGGGMDLLFPHHEAEIAQSVGACNSQPCNYWLHNNMITVNGKKMGKSLNNFITLKEFFSGDHEALDKPYDAMTIRFFILQAHYRSTADFSTEALTASQKGLHRLLEAYSRISSLKENNSTSNFNLEEWKKSCYDAMSDDFNTPILIAHLFDAAKFINGVAHDLETITAEDKNQLLSLFDVFLFDILGLTINEESIEGNSDLSNDLIELIIELRKSARADKNFALSDQIRDGLKDLGVEIKDTKEGTSFSIR